MDQELYDAFNNLFGYIRDMLTDADLKSIENEEPTSTAEILLHTFTAYAILVNIQPDTLQGDNAVRSLFLFLELKNKIDYDAFDLFIWSELC